ncbi:MAG: helix-hairpin-helix domain-containing protein [Bacteroidaceae bacterium]|nr:helix-hairpin-helix domain-containing protein [Bacteroidaceae bacterium]
MKLHRPDRRLILLIAVAVVALWMGILIDRWLLRPHRSSLVSLDEVAMDSLEMEPIPPKGDSTSSYYAVPVQEPATFPFDPNTADSTTLLRLGLAPWQVRSIYRYRARGGRYHQPSDFQRLPGMTPELWNRLSAYVQIGEKYRYYDREALAAASKGASSATARRDSSSTSVAAPSDSTYRPRYPYQEKFSELTILDLNTVDTTTLKKVPGIASVRARQIVRYRDRLGGFVSPEQLSEINGMPPELQAWFAVETGVYRKLNLNTTSIEQLSRHPYMGWKRARAIDNYRRSQGRLEALTDLQLLKEFTAEDFVRLQPYVEF